MVTMCWQAVYFSLSVHSAKSQVFNIFCVTSPKLNFPPNVYPSRLVSSYSSSVYDSISSVSLKLLSLFLTSAVASEVTWTVATCWMAFLSAAVTLPPLAPACGTTWQTTMPTLTMTTRPRSSTCTPAVVGRLWLITTWAWWIQLVLVCCQSS